MQAGCGSHALRLPGCKGAFHGEIVRRPAWLTDYHWRCIVIKKEGTHRALVHSAQESMEYVGDLLP